MSVRAFEPERIAISYRGKPLMRVRGLNLVDCSVLVNRYYGELKQLFSMVQDANRQEMLAVMVSSDFIMRVAATMPDFVGVFVSMACDGELDEATCAKLPIGVLIEAVNALIKLTVEDAGGPKELAALVKRLALTA
jgi:hypothetical protein